MSVRRCVCVSLSLCVSGCLWVCVCGLKERSFDPEMLVQMSERSFDPEGFDPDRHSLSSQKSFDPEMMGFLSEKSFDPEADEGLRQSSLFSPVFLFLY